MCGRYTLTVSLEELLLHYSLNPERVPFHEPRFNISPSQMVMSIIHDGQANRMGELSWGFIPSWAKEPKNRTINARAETLLEKPAFKIPFLRKRCIIPADSFYEWKTTGTGKQPMRIMLKSEGIFSLAGIYDTWTSPDGHKISSVAIITTEPNEVVAGIHNRMPLILNPEDEAVWLNRSIQKPGVLTPLLRPFSAENMKAYPVSPKVGSVRNDSPECIEELVK